MRHPYHTEEKKCFERTMTWENTHGGLRNAGYKAHSHTENLCKRSFVLRRRGG